MIAMILKMSAVVAGNILVTYGIWRYIKVRKSAGVTGCFLRLYMVALLFLPHTSVLITIT